ncbi:MAG: YdcF family protein [Polyangiaceae bacterium]
MALPARTSTQLVLPPISTVCGPGVGMLPRTPQKVIRMAESRDTAQESDPSTGLVTLFAMVEGSSLPELPAHAIVALGCRLHVTAGAGDAARFVLTGAALRRAEGAVAAYRAACERGEPTFVMVSGGRAWAGLVEADAMAEHMVGRGVPVSHVVRERTSHSTRENARYAGALLRQRGVVAVTLVTCAFHMARAKRMFELQGFEVYAAPSPSAPRGILGAAARWSKERVAEWMDERLSVREDG